MARVRKFLQEIFQRGEPSMRPEEEGHILLSRTQGMEALEAKYRRHALLATVEGERLPMSPATLVVALEQQSDVARSGVRVEVTYPADFFVLFKSEDDCDRVLHQSRQFRCGNSWISFRRWNRFIGAEKQELMYYSKVSVEGLPANAWEREFVSQLVTALKGKLISIEPRSDRWSFSFFAWLKNPCDVHKIYKVEIPEPLPSPEIMSSGSEDTYSPLTPTERKVWHTLTYRCIVHVEKVLDRGPLLTDHYPLLTVDNNEDLTRLHEFPVWLGRIDGTGPGNETESGGHPFRGPSNRAMDGDFIDRWAI